MDMEVVFSATFSTSGGSCPTALEALDSSRSYSLFHPGCSRHPSTARRKDAEKEVPILAPTLLSCSDGSFLSILKYVVVYLIVETNKSRSNTEEISKPPILRSTIIVFNNKKDGQKLREE